MELIQVIVPYLLGLFLLRIAAGIWGRKVETLIFVAVCCLSVYESSVGIMQVFGHRPSGHSLFAMTGNFQNPGPYGGFIGITTAMALCCLIRHRSLLIHIEVRRVLLHLPLVAAVAATVGGIIVLPASMSRSGWLAFILAVGLFLFRETELRGYLHRKKIVFLIAVSVLILGTFGAFLMKKDSAVGRLHIWRMECRAIAARPMGYGIGRRMGAYGDAQAAFFREKVRSLGVIKVAGCPEYAFNEFLGIGMDLGVPGLIAAVVITGWAIVALMRHRSVFGYCLVAYTVFALSSYPLSVPKLAALAVVPLAVTGCFDRHRKIVVCISAMIALSLIFLVYRNAPRMRARKIAEKEWRVAKAFENVSTPGETADSLALLTNLLENDYRYLYDYGYALFESNRYKESISILEKGTRISSDPMFRNIIGRDKEALGDFEGAQREYLQSHYMVPDRLYPMVLLKEMYEKTGQREKAKNTLMEIRKMEVNSKNLTMKELAERAENEIAESDMLETIKDGK